MTLVTGATGFIGSHLLDRLSATNQPFRCLLRRNSRRKALPAGVDSVEADFDSGEGFDRALDGVAVVIHLAGVTKALRPADYYTGNARATAVLAKAIAIAGKGIRLVHVSSLAAAGPSPDGHPLNEDFRPRPVSHYGKSKLEAEIAVRGSLPDAVIVRPPVVYGPRDTDVFRILKPVSRGFLLQLGEGGSVSAIFVRDLVEGLLTAARHPAARGRTYFLANPHPFTWTELGKSAARIMGGAADRPLRILRIPPAVARVVGFAAEMVSWITRKPGIVSREKVAEAQCPYWVCDPRRAADEMGFQAATALDAGLSETLAWYKDAGWLKY
jgi:nucleoside-diphosphate-sugar epimerase